MLIDLHVHSQHSPGCGISAEEAIAKAAELGLDGICFTDRDTVASLRSLSTWRASETPIPVFAGVEASTDHGRLLCFFPDPEKVPDWKEVAAEAGGGAGGEAGVPPSTRELIRVVRRLGGATVAAHPYERSIDRPMGDYLFTLDGLSAVEGFVGKLPPMVNELAIEAADRLGLPCVGGSGAFDSIDEIGTAATLFRDVIGSDAELVEALLHGKVWAAAIGERVRFAGDDQPPRRDGRRRHGGRRGGRRGGRAQR